eukprot:5658537-Pyramimonas_sp.AAC.1
MPPLSPHNVSWPPSGAPSTKASVAHLWASRPLQHPPHTLRGPVERGSTECLRGAVRRQASR